MGIVTQFSRLQHHTIYGFTGSTFSVPTTEDFSTGAWTIYDLAISEIGVNETDEKAYIRIGNTIKEFSFEPDSDSGTQSLSDTLGYGNYADTYNIRMGSGYIQSDSNISKVRVNDGELRFDAYTMSFINPGFEFSKKVVSKTLEKETNGLVVWDFHTITNSEIGTNGSVSFDAVVQCRDTTNNTAFFARLFAGFLAVGGSVTQVGITDIVTIASATAASANISTDGTDIKLQVTGITGSVLRWTTRLNYQINN